MEKILVNEQWVALMIKSTYYKTPIQNIAIATGLTVADVCRLLDRDEKKWGL